MTHAPHLNSPSGLPPDRRLAREPGVRPLLLGTFTLSLLAALTGALAWWTTARLINAVFLNGAPLPTQTAALTLLAAALLLRAALNATREALTGRRAARLTAHLRERALTQATRLGPVALADIDGAHVTLTATEAPEKLRAYYARYLPTAAHAAATLPVFLGAALLLDPLGALVLTVTAPVCIAFLILVGLATRTVSDRAWTGLLRLQARTLDAARGLPTLVAYGRAHARADSLAREADEYRVSTLRVLRVAFLSGFVLDLAATLSTALVAVIVGVRLFEGHLTFTPALAVLLYTPEFFAPLRTLGTERHAALDAHPAARDLYALLDTPTLQGGATPPPDGAPALTLRDVQVRLPGRTLPPVTFALAAGEHAALVGPSGAGKTALLHALMGFAPVHGDLLVHGAPLSTLDLPAWRARVALVTQHARVRAGALRAHLLTARPDATDDELHAALRAAHVPDLPDGLNTRVGDGGLPLSGGERARLAVARALLADAPLVLLDEPFAHLDTPAEHALHAALARALAGRTVLLVTHRPPPPGFRTVHLGATP
ncbi:thiol reductant ABC exporter subunit CydD [Deinococcus maricopensis]|uniref:Xenobiotic-transporting ATPase n=1 Tax=Deinococcus maricopensis (strain DSM 21211 / LMG 22137 / NRRL B-23946 / LB-34) TaxID=709986 RepID=E8U7D8_DEIML|nr:thiol reductant ABC exporter subunit CydD [Deinococcus maricopensis]ADV66977.1 Xenobiotic-transporting ATPase [Deinococcus maricopensis DSM 21211]